MRLQGTVLNAEHITGTSNSGSPYSFHRVAVLTTNTRKVVEARIGTNPQPIPVPAEGDVVDLDVDVSAYRDRVSVNVLSQHRDREPVLLG